MPFKDHFSGHAALYAKYRPVYPPTLYEYLAGLTLQRQVALDCATGNGQAAVGLAAHFELVIGTDGSMEQLQNAQAADRVAYVGNLAEQPAFRDGSIDLVAVAQAVHWFDHDRFYAEVHRVLRPDGVVAVWTYGLATIAPQVDAIVADLHSRIAGAYWPPERRYVDAAYRNLPFPFREEAVPPLELRLEWNLDTLMGYLSTWSAVQRYTKARGESPLPDVQRRIEQVWNSPEEQRSVVWPLHLRVGRAWS